MKIFEKTASFIGAVFFVFALASCASKPDLFADFKEMPAIYGLLDYKADTNFIKISRVFVTDDNPSEIVQNPAVNYYPDKLDAKLVEYCDGELIREIRLDTITKTNMKFYYTAERLKKNTKNDHYRYELVVVVDGKTIVSSADMVGGDMFRIVTPHLNFGKNAFGVRMSMKFAPAPQATFYDVTVAFHYKERRLPSKDTVETVFHFIKDRFYKGDLEQTLAEDGYYSIYYHPEHFYTGFYEFLGDDTLNHNVLRYITDYPLEIIIEAGGMEMMNYYKMYDANIANAQFIPDFGCVGEGAVGLFSSRSRLTRRGRLAGHTVIDLMDMGWGFKYIGGKEE
ncbi:MAG: hypothetical protein J6P73_01450 [Bacteroidales bacterium]|nr:hypothetical protein [Bacteroidales bacterium]